MRQAPLDRHLAPAQPSAWPVAALLAVCVPLFFVGLGAYDLDMKAEPREGITAWETIHGGDWLLPMLNGERLPEKPLMFPWIASISMRLFGETSEWALRLPSAAMAVGLVLVVYATARRLLGPRGGLMSALACASTFLVVSLARRARVDMTLTFFMCLALLQFVAEFQRDEDDSASRPSTPRTLVFWLALACGTLTKGPLGFILPGLAIGGYLLARGRFAFLRKLCRPWGVALFVALAGSWYAYGLAHAGGEFGFRSFLMENVLMFFGAANGGGHRHGLLYFVPNYFFFGLPWSLLLPAALLLVARRARGAWRIEPLLLPLTWFAAMFVFFSVARGKRADYLLPLMPAAAMLVAGAWDTVAESPDALARRALVGSAWVLAAVGAGAAAVVAFLAWAPVGALPDALASLRTDEGARPLFEAVASAPAASVVVLAGLVVAAAAPSVSYAALRPAWGVAAAACGVATAVAVGVVALLPATSTQDSLKQFSAEMTRITGADAQVRSFETFEPQLFFYLGRRIRRLDGGRSLDAYLDEPGPAWVLTDRQTFARLDPRRQARLDLVMESHRADTDADGQCMLLRRARTGGGDGR